GATPGWLAVGVLEKVLRRADGIVMLAPSFGHPPLMAGQIHSHDGWAWGMESPSSSSRALAAWPWVSLLSPSGAGVKIRDSWIDIFSFATEAPHGRAVTWK